MGAVTKGLPARAATATEGYFSIFGFLTAVGKADANRPLNNERSGSGYFDKCAIRRSGVLSGG